MGVEQRLSELSRRRAELMTLSAAQRAELGNTGLAWRVPLAVVDQGVTVWRFFRMHPALLVGAGVALAVARPSRVVKWLGRGWTVWSFFRDSRARGQKPQ